MMTISFEKGKKNEKERKKKSPKMVGPGSSSQAAFLVLHPLDQKWSKTFGQPSFNIDWFSSFSFWDEMGKKQGEK